ncbi:MAG: hypothetical protein V8S22_01610 [Lachnospiraceae bacterium]
MKRQEFAGKDILAEEPELQDVFAKIHTIKEQEAVKPEGHRKYGLCSKTR